VLVAAVFAGLFTALLPSAPAHAAGNPRFTLALHDTFSSLNTARWGRYSGQPGGNPHGLWSPRHVVASGGAAHLRGYREGGRFVTGGMMLTSLPQTYGKYVVRARFDRSPGVEHVMLLWPTSGWPPEVDFSEGSGAGSTMATSHWGAKNSQTHRFLKVDMTKWHTYGVEWTPTRLLFTVDGRAWAQMTGAAVPHQPMRLALQTAATTKVGAANTREVRMSIADVYVWRYRR
jgi:beta-glucanase (GH16 family)